MEGIEREDGAETLEGFEGIIGQHASMLSIFDVIRRVAPTDATVLITGESGTGKELVAAALHRLSSCSAGRCRAAMGKPPRRWPTST